MYVSMSVCKWLSLWVYVIVSGNVLVCCCVLLSLYACKFEYHHLCERVNLTCEWFVTVWVWAHMFQWIFKYVHVWKCSCVSECEYMSLCVCEGTSMFMHRKCMSMWLSVFFPPGCFFSRLHVHMVNCKAPCTSKFLFSIGSKLSLLCITSHCFYKNTYDSRDSTCWLHCRITAQKLKCREISYSKPIASETKQLLGITVWMTT